MENINPPQPGRQLGPQPDFGRLTESLQQATTEFAKFANLPPIAQSTAILQQMQQMQEQMEQNHQQMQQNHQQMQHQIQQVQQQVQQVQQQVQQNHVQTQHQFQQVQQQVQQNHQQTQQQIQQLRTDITTGLQTTEYNSIARLQNSGIGRPDAPLTALHEYATNADVQGFPATPAQLSTMSGPALDHVLTALSLPTNGTTADKKQRLRFYVGLKDTR